MRALVDTGPVSPGDRLGAAFILDAWRGITPPQLRAALTLGCAAFFYHVIVWSHGMLQRPSLLRPLAATFIHDQLGAFLLMLAVVVVDRMSGTSVPRRMAYAAAVVASALISAPLGSVIAQSIVTPRLSAGEVLDSAIYTFCEWVILSGAALFVYRDRRRARIARTRMHAAELERVQAAKRTLESRLQAMQARVEPRFLFNTLAQVRDLYRIDATLGERMLDELIAYLRAAMPKMRDTSSTVGQEIELVRAYLGIVRPRLGEQLTFEIGASEGIADAPLPPMMLLPLLDHVLAQGPAGASRTICIRAGVVDGRIRLVIADSGDGFLPEREGESIAGIRDRLDSLYGRNGTLELRRRGSGATEAVLEIPIVRGDEDASDGPIRASAAAATDAAAAR